MRLSRRNMLLGALAVPTIAGLAHWRWQHGSQSGLLYDPSLQAGRRFAAAVARTGGASRALDGDRVRLAREILDQRPALLAGISLHADALMIGEVAAEAGYSLAAELHGKGARCEGFTCNSGWIELTRMAVGAGEQWVEAFAGWAAAPQAPELPNLARAGGGTDKGLVLGWVLVPRA